MERPKVPTLGPRPFWGLNVAGPLVPSKGPNLQGTKAMQQAFTTLCSETARKVASLTPCARSDPFYARRLYTHFVNGAEDVHEHGKFVKEVEKAQAPTPEPTLESTPQAIRSLKGSKVARKSLRSKAPNVLSEDTAPSNSNGLRKASAPKRTRRRAGNHTPGQTLSPTQSPTQEEAQA